MKPTQHKPQSKAAPQRTLCPDLLEHERAVYILAVHPGDTPSEFDKQLFPVIKH
ncbi:unnamed protein product [Staurois parvus]|uniref:Uncharacterized protein n=1 Tax=Staurois parvus TaxID=386267 RepID=A0ABN9AD48_9NEOB|nr:unnamed protein product [Staurois parvus]